MRQNVRLVALVACITGSLACDFPRPANVGGQDAADGAVDASGGDAANDGAVDIDALLSLCSANQPLRCEGNSLVRCNSDGTAEVRESCALGCRSDELRCNDVRPSNGLATFLDMTAGEPDLDLGTDAIINTDEGTITVDGHSVAVRTATVTQSLAPTIRVFVVHRLLAGHVTVTGSDALAFVSDADITIGGTFAASATSSAQGPGGFNDTTCTGGDGATAQLRGGCGGGGFGFDGARGGDAVDDDGRSLGGRGGAATGSATLVPLRGGCDSGIFSGLAGRGGGALQLVSRSKITIGGIVAANGSSNTGGGSGGGILLEAPIVEIVGTVVANGGAGAGGCPVPIPAEDGRLDATPAAGGAPCTFGGGGGRGGALNTGAGIGATADRSGHSGAIGYGGHGGGSVGRIRINTVSGGLHATGVLSPTPSTGTIATR